MSWTSRVIWQEGMFLRSQHFQQQDRWFESCLRMTTLRPYGWGLKQVSIDHNLLRTGRFAASSASGVFEDGTVFSLPGETDHPAPLEVAENTRGVLIHLALPIQQVGGLEVASGDGEAGGRYKVHDFEAYDTHTASAQAADILVGQLKLRYLLDTDDRSGYLCIPLARVVEVLSDKSVVLDEAWLPPALFCRAVPALSGFINEFLGMVHQRAEVLAARVNAPSTRGVAEVSDFMLLQALNRWQALLQHWVAAANIHPETLYSAYVQMAAELMTFTEKSRRLAKYPGYRHEDLQRSFAPVIADLRRSLSSVIETNAVSIPLQLSRHGVYVGVINDRNILQGANFVLTVQADIPNENMRRLFPSQVKIGAVEHIRELVNVALPGIAVHPLPVAPRQIPFYAGGSYFELDRNSQHWQKMQTSGGFAIHVSGDFPNLHMELWAIRG